MNHSLAALKKKIHGLNRRVLTARDFRRITERERIYVDFWSLQDGVNGFYGLNRKYKRPVKYIVIEKDLLPDHWLPTAFHELIHHFIHAPQSDLVVYFSKVHAKAREERHADMFSLVMRLPLPLFLQLADTPFEEIHGFTRAELIERKRIYETYGY